MSPAAARSSRDTSASIRTPSDFTPANRAYQPFGAAKDLLYCRDKEIMLSGPAGTGKSRANLEKLHLCALKYDGMRGLIVRKTRSSLTQTGLVTYEDKVLPQNSPICATVQRRMRQSYYYPNGSEIVVGGLDDITKVMSSEYDLIYVQEAIEAEEDEWEKLTTRLRNNVMPYQQIIGDTNPDVPTHWLKQRESNGQTRFLESRHEDNPSVTDDYLATLDALTGVRKDRLRYGRWVAAEGVIYEGWDRKVHLIDRRTIPRHWPRYWVMDFGFTNPFVWQAWAEDPDGRLFRYREIYKTKTLVEDHAKAIRDATEGEPPPVAVICDHDAEDRATLERHLNIRTTAAHKTVSDGIQATASRLRDAGDGQARLYLMRDSLVEADPELVKAKKPTCTEEEIDGYVWDMSAGKKRGEQPVKMNDHGCDDMRYMVAYKDLGVKKVRFQLI